PAHRSYLQSNGANLAPFLLALRLEDPVAWRRIESWVHLVAPVVQRLDPVLVGPRAVPTDELDAEKLATSYTDVPVRLDWVDERGERFGPAELSDGTLRAIALFTALGQTAARRPHLVAIDEPELGLHPAAIDVLCSVLGTTADAGQVLLATQSPRIIDAFDAKAVRVVGREDGATTVRPVDEEGLQHWLDDYTVSQLVDMNVIGGRP
ncbi:MAG: AAA family ATPase, partial [Myxococcota bacterium]